mmetsp:Transcript_134370/g.335239  ORF Transcript_134370/g.335239 Transcript_134370/m.335239 type:complete len:121 (+) Transcript_134370:163-525(+)
MVAPNLGKDRRDIDAPSSELSSTDSLSPIPTNPKLQVPTRLTAEPKRFQLLMDKDAPTRQTSRTENAEARRTNVLSDIDDPKCAKSITDKENREPTREKPRIDREAPNRAKVRSDIDAPK